MSREPVDKQEAIDKLRQQIEPEQYLESLKEMKVVYLQRAARVLGDHDMNVASPTIDERDVEMVNKQTDDTLAELSWRVDTLDGRIKDFEATKKDVTRPFDRAPVPEVNEEPEDAVTNRLQDAVADAQETADDAREALEESGESEEDAPPAPLTEEEAASELEEFSPNAGKLSGR